VVENFDNDYYVIDDVDGKFLVKTNYEAPKYRIIEIDPANPARENWKTVLPEKEEVLESISLVGGKIVAEYMKDATSKAYIYDVTGNLISDVSFDDF
jgi:prolyl oligopeptidase